VFEDGGDADEHFTLSLDSIEGDDRKSLRHGLCDLFVGRKGDLVEEMTGKFDSMLKKLDVSVW
jgi:hypothetical protein